MAEKTRIDVLLVEQGLAPSREKARAMIMAGEVSVNGQMIDKPGTRIAADATVTLRAKPRYVSRGGDKLAGALVSFGYDPAGKICADLGASTGGFTDCLLQHGATRIYAIDVGYGQLDYGIRSNQRVIVMERTNARYLETLAEPVELVVVDASFISLRLLLPVIRGWLTSTGDVIALIKPQFEAGRSDVGKGGVVRDTDIHRRVIHEVIESAQTLGFSVAGLTMSPLKGPAGNTEFLVWLSLDLTAALPAEALDVLIQTVINF
jgi:23S rRNA (cytidine1920-2'-O)/16S rRNA (cytidine1409-2'-O)-methyltransferase